MPWTSNEERWHSNEFTGQRIRASSPTLTPQHRKFSPWVKETEISHEKFTLEKWLQPLGMSIYFSVRGETPRGETPPPRQKLELSSGGWAPCIVQASPARLSVLGTHLSQCPSWGCSERLHWASVSFFKTLSESLPISWWVIYERTCPHLTECWVVFDQKRHDPCAPPSLFTWSHPKPLCLFPWIKKVLKGKHFASAEEVKQKMAAALKSIKSDELEYCFEQWKKHLDRCIAPSRQYSEGDWSLNM